MKQYLTCGEVALECGVRPRDISDAFYARHLNPDRTLLIAGRRLVPADMLPEIKTVLERLGRIRHDSPHAEEDGDSHR